MNSHQPEPVCTRPVQSQVRRNSVMKREVGMEHHPTSGVVGNWWQMEEGQFFQISDPGEATIAWSYTYALPSNNM